MFEAFEVFFGGFELRGVDAALCAAMVDGVAQVQHLVEQDVLNG